MQIELPKQVEWILDKLKSHGFEAFIVGGCVRDAVLGRTPEDWDITTSARPEQVKGIFGKTIDTGLQHGTVTVMREHVGYEVTTYRIDGEYEDGRHPKEVIFTSELREDLRRRDFTINAMAYSRGTGIVDEFGGMEDLRRGVIRCVGDAGERFTEDALRILRAIRFSAQLGFRIEEETWRALSVIAPNLSCVSKERIQAELTKTLLSPNPEKILLTGETGMDPYISKTFSEVIRSWGAMSELSRAAGLKSERALRWAAFLAVSGEQRAVSVLKELKMDNDTIRRTRVLARYFAETLPTQKAGLRRLIGQTGRELFWDLLALRAALFPESKALMDAAGAMAEEILSAGDCLSLKDLAVSGKDLIQSGMKPGKALGDALDRLLDQVLVHPEYNTKEKLFSLLVQEGSVKSRQ